MVDNGCAVIIIEYGRIIGQDNMHIVIFITTREAIGSGTVIPAAIKIINLLAKDKTNMGASLQANGIKRAALAFLRSAGEFAIDQRHRPIMWMLHGDVFAACAILLAYQ